MNKENNNGETLLDNCYYGVNDISPICQEINWSFTFGKANYFDENGVYILDWEEEEEDSMEEPDYLEKKIKNQKYMIRCKLYIYMICVRIYFYNF